MISSDVVEDWQVLSLPWRRCLELAWEALGSGTVPAGAVLTNAAGQIVTEGRNGVYARLSNGLHLSPLAHAEVNALVDLDPASRYEDHVLYASLEPCLLCIGAVVMTAVGKVRFAGRDFYGGATAIRPTTPHQSRLPLAVSGPREDVFGLFASGLLVAYFEERKPGGHVMRAFSGEQAIMQMAQSLIRVRAKERAAAGESLPDVLGLLAAESAASAN